MFHSFLSFTRPAINWPRILPQYSLPVSVRLSTQRSALTLYPPSRLEAHLLHLLQTTGYTEQLRTQVQERLRTGEVTEYGQLLEEMVEFGMGIVDDGVKKEIVGRVREVVGGWVEG